MIKCLFPNQHTEESRKIYQKYAERKMKFNEGKIREKPEEYECYICWYSEAYLEYEKDGKEYAVKCFEQNKHSKVMQKKFREIVMSGVPEEKRKELEKPDDWECYICWFLENIDEDVKKMKKERKLKEAEMKKRNRELVANKLGIKLK